MQNKPIVNKSANGFQVDKSEEQKKRESIQNNANPTNREIADLLEMVLKRTEG